MTPEDIRAARRDAPDLRDRDFADRIGISEGELVHAFAGHGVVRIDPRPDVLIPRVGALGEVMALTRNGDVVHEKVGTYDNFHPGDHAAMVLADAIDLRIFPRHWVHAFAVEREGERGLRRSVQVFEAAGDAVHKVHLRDGSDLNGWAALRAELECPAGEMNVEPRAAVEPAKADDSRAEALRKEWARLTDSHQFLTLTRRLKMNRLGAYRVAGSPFAEALAPSSLERLIERLAESGTPSMIFVGNKGCIQIHSGPIQTLRPMGPWQNIMDPGFNLHLRRDRVAEVWLVEKPTRRGPAISVEAFDAEGGLILQIFGMRKEDADHVPAFAELARSLDRAGSEVAAQ